MTKLARQMLEMGAWLAVLIATCLLFPSCPKPTPGPGGEPPAHCGLGVVNACAPQVLPLINECLAGGGDVVPCILGITKLVGCATYEILACVVKDQGDRAAAAVHANPADERDARRAERARDFLARTGARFE